MSNERHPRAKLITITAVVACTISFAMRIAPLLFSQPVLLRTDLRLERIAFDSRTKIISVSTLRAEFLVRAINSRDHTWNRVTLRADSN